MKKFLLGTVVFLLLIGGVGATVWYKVQDQASTDEFGAVPSAVLERRLVINEVEAIGLVKARESSIINAPFDGKLSMLIPEGTFVNKGDIVAEMEVTDLQDRLDEREVELEVRKSELEQREAELKLLIEENRLQLESEKAQVEFSDVSLEDAKRQFEEQKEMVARNLVAEGSLESERINLLQAELNVKDAKIKLRKLQENQSSKVRSKEADIRKANVRVEKEQDRIDELREKIESAKVVSTRDGFINYLMTWRGKRVKIAEGDNVWRRSGILEIPDATQMEVTVPINELDITSIEEGQKATVSVAAIPGETFPGKVNRKGKVPITRVNDPFGNNREGVKNFEVFIELDEQDKRLRQNMTATAVIEVAREEDTLAVPLDAIFSKKGSDGEKNTYYVLLNDGGNLAEIEVKQQVVGSNFATVEPVGDGVTLAEGSRVLLRDPRK